MYSMVCEWTGDNGVSSATGTRQVIWGIGVNKEILGQNKVFLQSV